MTPINHMRMTIKKEGGIAFLLFVGKPFCDSEPSHRLDSKKSHILFLYPIDHNAPGRMPHHNNGTAFHNISTV